jgi:CRP/FNR family transcriptional regulator, cyclic AMP receptor protein
LPVSDSANAPDLFIARLRESPLFGSLGEDSLAYLGRQAKLTHYPAGAVLFWEGEPSQGLYWLQSGTLKAVKYAAAGREQILHLIEPGQTFNEVGAVSTLPNPASVAALSPAQVWRIPGAAIKQLIAEDPEFAQMIIDVLSSRLRHSAGLVEDLSLRPVISRLSRLILDEAQGDTLLRPSWYTQNELASRLGTVTDVVQRSLRQLEAENLIEVERRQIVILDRDQLEQRAG